MESKEKPTLIIRADASAKIGSGHIMRCFALAQTWQSQNGNVIFVTNCESLLLIEKLKIEGFELVEIENSYPNNLDWKKTKQILNKLPDSWCIVDGYHYDSEYYSLIRQNGNRVLVVDDTIRFTFYEADAILNQNINAEKLDYQCPPKTQLLLGTEFTMLRQEFLKWQDLQRETPEIAKNILITMGGSDFYNQTSKAIQAIESLHIENLKIRAVIGSSNSHLADLEDAIEKSPIIIELIRDAENMSELMDWADLAISAAGSTCWELAFMKLPTVLIVTANNQIGIAEGLGESGFAENLGWFEKVSVENLAERLNKVLLDKTRRETMCETGREVVDGRGTKRIIEILQK